jgi:PAS domain S-box-containing protein
MVKLLFFTAMVQILLLTVFLGTKATRKHLPSVLIFLLTLNYGLILFAINWNLNMPLQLTKLYIPIGYASGPIYYYFVRFSFLPAKKIQSNRWLWWFAPFVFQVFIDLTYWLSVAFESSWYQPIGDLARAYFRYDFSYFIGFFIAILVFLVRNNNSFLTLNLVYKRQLNGLKVFLIFIALFILDEIFGREGDYFFSSLIACSFTSSMVFFWMNNNPVFSEEEKQGKELLKEALDEREKPVVVTNGDRVVEYANEPFLTNIGYRHRDVIGRKLSFLYGSLTTKESLEFIGKKMSEKISFEASIVCYRKNGEAFESQIKVFPVFLDEKITHFIAYIEHVKTISSATPQDEDLLIFEKFNNYFKAHQPCNNPHLQVADVAEPLGISSRRLGEVLKRCGDQSFSEYVNSSRIKEALKMLRDPEYQHLTIEAIGQKCGFNSKSVFHTAFKKETGKTPKAFLEEEES